MSELASINLRADPWKHVWLVGEVRKSAPRPENLNEWRKAPRRDASGKLSMNEPVCDHIKLCVFRT